jgi:hypothetical protein
MLILKNQLGVCSLEFISLVAASGYSASPDLVKRPKPPYILLLKITASLLIYY